MHCGSIREIRVPLVRLLLRGAPGLLLCLLLAAPASAQASPAADTPAAPERAPLRGVTLGALRADPARYAGALVQWRGQFLAVAGADSLRSDLRPGETYLLAREPGGEPGYTYVVVPPRLREAARRLVPLERVELVARVRTGRSALMEHPILDLVEILP